MGIDLYSLFPYIIRYKDKLALGQGAGTDLEGVLQKITSALEHEFDVTKAEIDNLSKLINPDECDPKFLLYMSMMLGIPIDEGHTEAFRRWFVKNIVYFHKMKGTHQSWKKQSLFLFSKVYRAWELWKKIIYEVGDYSRTQDYEHGLRAARFDMYDQSTGQFISPENMPLGENLASYFERLRPVHVLLRRRVAKREVSDSFPSTSEALDVAFGVDFQEESQLVDQGLDVEMSCIGACESSCTGFMEAGCTLSCTAGCEAGCEGAGQVAPGSQVVATPAGANIALNIVGAVAPFQGIAGISAAALEVETFLAYVTATGYDTDPMHHQIRVALCYPLELWCDSGGSPSFLTDFDTDGAGCELSCQTEAQGGALPNWTDLVSGVDRGIPAYYWAEGPDEEDPVDLLTEGLPMARPRGVLATTYEGDTLTPHLKMRMLLGKNKRGDYVVVRLYRPHVLTQYLDPVVGNGIVKQFTGNLPTQPVPMSVVAQEVTPSGLVRQVALADAYGDFKGSIDPTGINEVWSESLYASAGPYSYDIRFEKAPLPGSRVQFTYKAFKAICTFLQVMDILHKGRDRLFEWKHAGSVTVPALCPCIPTIPMTGTGLDGGRLALKAPEGPNDEAALLVYVNLLGSVAAGDTGLCMWPDRPFTARVDQLVNVGESVGVRYNAAPILTFARFSVGFRVLAYLGQSTDTYYYAILVRDPSPALLKSTSAPAADKINVRVVTEDGDPVLDPAPDLSVFVPD